MKILLIAPNNPNLPSIDAEIGDITHYHDTKLVVGDVRETDIQAAIREGPYDVIWFATHGGEAGIQLSNEIVIDPIGIELYVVNSGADLCVLNTCASEETARKIIVGGKADIVYTISNEVGDTDAQRFAALFSKALSETEDYKEAFDLAAGVGSTKYRYLDAKVATRALTLQSVTELERLRIAVEGLDKGQYKLTVDVSALDTRVTQAIQQILQNQQASLANEKQTRAISIPLLTALAWALALVGIFTSILLFVAR